MRHDKGVAIEGNDQKTFKCWISRNETWMSQQ